MKAEQQQVVPGLFAALRYGRPAPQPFWRDLALVASRLLLIALRPKRHRTVLQALRNERLTLIRAAQPHLSFKYLRRNYIANTLSRAERAAILAHHYRFLTSQPCAEIGDYLGGIGIRLWRHEGRITHEIRLRVAGPVDNEGELALEYLADRSQVGVIGFSFAPAALFGQHAQAVPLVSRIQSTTSDAAVLREVAKDHHDIAPRLALAAALQGLTAGLRLSRITGVSRSNQVAYMSDHEAVLASTYDDFYRSLGGRPGQAGFFDLDVPFREAEPAQASSAHRRRSRKRRMIRQAVADEAERTVAILFRNDTRRSTPCTLARPEEAAPELRHPTSSRRLALTGAVPR